MQWPSDTLGVRIDIGTFEGHRRTTQPGSAKKRTKRMGTLTKGSNVVRGAHILNPNTVAATFAGETYLRDGSRRQHDAKSCTNLRPDGTACSCGLYTDLADVQEKMEAKHHEAQEKRADKAYAVLCRGLGKGKGQTPRFEIMNALGVPQPVCRDVFLLRHHISGSTLDRLILRAKQGFEHAHKKDEEGGSKARSPSADKTDGIVSWYVSYSKQIGDYDPDKQLTCVPRRFRCEEYAEFKGSVDPSQHCGYKHFCHVLRFNWELDHIHRARKLLNFQVRVRVRVRVTI